MEEMIKRLERIKRKLKEIQKDPKRACNISIGKMEEYIQTIEEVQEMLREDSKLAENKHQYRMDIIKEMTRNDNAYRQRFKLYAKCAERLNISERYVKYYLTLINKGSKQLLELVAQEKIPVVKASGIAAKYNKDEQDKICKQIREENDV